MKKVNNLLTRQPLEGLVSALAVAAVATAVSFLPCSASAQELYRDQMNNGAGWGTNASGTDFAATFDYDYSADGIPEAPHTQAGDDATRGVKLEANLTTATVDYFTLYPLGQNFTGSWQLRFDAWMNYGTSGTTEFLGGGIGYDNVSADLLAMGAPQRTIGRSRTVSTFPPQPRIRRAASTPLSPITWIFCLPLMEVLPELQDSSGSPGSSTWSAIL